MGGPYQDKNNVFGLWHAIAVSCLIYIYINFYVVNSIKKSSNTTLIYLNVTLHFFIAFRTNLTSALIIITDNFRFLCLFFTAVKTQFSVNRSMFSRIYLVKFFTARTIIKFISSIDIFYHNFFPYIYNAATSFFYNSALVNQQK